MFTIGDVMNHKAEREGQKAIRAYLIDPANSINPVQEVVYTGDYGNIYKHIGADCFDVARFNDKGDGVFVDDNGLLKPQSHFFMIEGNVNLLAGKGLVLGCDDEGESVAPTVDLEWLKDNVATVEILPGGIAAIHAPTKALQTRVMMTL